VPYSGRNAKAWITRLQIILIFFFIFNEIYFYINKENKKYYF